MEESDPTKLIPNATNAVVDIRKLRDYCLNSEHSTGKHKARLFQSILGMRAENAPELRHILLEAVKTYPAKLGRFDDFGQRYTLDFTLSWQNKSAVIRSGWIIEINSLIPRLTSGINHRSSRRKSWAGSSGNCSRNFS
jgi:hypothetical protein